jgi:non-ribosomal peptide synthetase component F
LPAPQLAFRAGRRRASKDCANALNGQQDFSLVKITPAHLEVLAHLLPPENAAGSTRALVIGGEALFAEGLSYWFEHAPQTRLINEYGPTETVVGCCVYEVRDGAPRSGAVPIGRPIANTILRVLDNHLQPVPIGVNGELYIGGDGVARGYLNSPSLTAAKFIPDPSAHNPERGCIEPATLRVIWPTATSSTSAVWIPK